MTQAEEITIQKSVLIKQSQKNLYHILRNFDKIPFILDFLENVLTIDNTHSRWTAKIGTEEERIIWDVEIVREKEYDFFEWHSSGNADILQEGRIQFTQNNLHQGTLLSLQLRFYFPPFEDNNTNVMGDDFENRIQDNLFRFKQAIEANEFPYPRDDKNNIPEGFSADEGPWRDFM